MIELKNVLIITLLIFALFSTSALAEDQDKCNFVQRIYTDVKYDTTIALINNSTSDVVALDPSQFDFNISGANTSGLDIKTNDPNANLTASFTENGIKIIDNSKYKYMFDIQIKYSDLEPMIRDGKVLLIHYDDSGKEDALWYQKVENNNGYAYFNDLPFSEIDVPGSGYAYIPNYNGNSVSVVNLASNSIVKTITVGTQPFGVAVNNIGSRIYISNAGSGTVSVIDGGTDTVTSTVTVGTAPKGIAVTPDRTKIYVANNGGNTVSVITASTNTVTSTITVGNQPYGVAINPAGTYVYVTNYADGTVSVISTASNTVTATFASSLYGGADSWPMGVTVSPDGSKIYVCSYKYDKVYCTTSAGVASGSVSSGSANCVAINPAGTYIYSTSNGGTNLHVSNANTMAAIATVPIGVSSGTEGVFVDPDGTTVYITTRATPWGNALYKIRTSDNTITGNITGFNKPYAMGAIMRTTTTAPTASFTASPTSAGTGQTVTFTDGSTGGPTSWQWSFGDGTANSTSQSPTHSYASVGTYTVILTVSNSVGSNTQTRTNYITVTLAPPTANFVSDKTSGNVPLDIQFTDTSTGGATSWSWSFGDGATSTTQSPAHQFISAGTYTVSLNATGPGGSNTVTKTGYITVTTPKPVVSFSGTPTSGNIPLYAVFTDSSTGNPSGWRWDFGDGGTSTDQNPTHTYNSAGTYTVTLTATNSGGSTTSTLTGYVTAMIAKPVSSFSATPLTGNVPFNVQFADSSTNNPIAWSWDFGDGGLSTSRNPIHRYTVAGTYSVTLTSTNIGGGNTTIHANYINALVPKPVSAFIATPTSGNTPLNVQFTDRSTYTPTSWLWDFGDGTTSNSQNPSHTYTTAGAYNVMLTATNTGGSDSITKNNYIYSFDITPSASFMHNDILMNNTSFGTEQFIDTSTNKPTSWHWTFGDGRTSDLQNPLHKYLTNGTYNVTLKVSNAGGSNTVSQNIDVISILNMQLNTTTAKHITVEGNESLNKFQENLENWNTTNMINVITSPFTDLMGMWFYAFVILGLIVFSLITYGGKATIPVIMVLLFGSLITGLIPEQFRFMMWLGLALGVGGALYSLVRNR